MSDLKTTEPFEARFGELVRVYTDASNARPIDALAVSRAAMTVGRATGWSSRRLGAGLTARRESGRWAAAAVAVVLVSVVGVAVWSRSSNSGIGPQPTPTASSGPSPIASAVGPVPEALRHLWQRPLPVAPGPAWASSSLVLTDELLGVGSEPGTALHSAVAAAGPDSLVVTATPESVGCALGDLGVYRFALEGKDTFVTLTASSPDGCAAREDALTGPWVRADLPQPGESDLLRPGTYTTTGFDPFTDDATPDRLSYTVPAGWKVKGDGATAFVLHHLADASQAQAGSDTFIFMVAQPRLAAAFGDKAVCGDFKDATGVGTGVDEIVAAIIARPGVVATPPAKVTVGGYKGTLLDLRVAPAWTGGCMAPEGPVVGIPIMRGPGAELGPTLGLSPAAPVRLLLLDLGGGRTMSIAIVTLPSPDQPSFDESVAAAMPIVESIELHAPTP